MDIVLSYVASFLIIILVLPVHEFAHAFAAVKAGDPTPKLAGRYTINPLKHFDLVGLLMLILVRFGWAKPVPVNPYNFSKPRRDYFLVSIAGILANFIMAFVFSLLYAVYIQYVLPRIPITSVRSLEYVLAKLFYYVFFYAGASRMLASQAFIVNYLWPIMSVLCACIILKERMTVKKGVAIGLSFLGVVIVMWRNLLSFDRNTLVGAALCVLGAVSYGLFTSLNQKKQYNKSLSMMLNYTATFVLTSVITAVSGDLFFPTAVQVVGFAWNGVLTMALANTAWIMALSRGETAKISNLVYITPFLSLLWTWLVLREPLEINFIAGLAIIVLGILIQLSKVPLCALALRRSDGKR